MNTVSAHSMPNKSCRSASTRPVCSSWTFQKKTAMMCQVARPRHEHHDNQVESIAWSQTSPPEHFIFTSMSFDRAVDWVQLWRENEEMQRRGISVDMHDTYSDDESNDTFSCLLPSASLVALTLPSSVLATHIERNFLSNCCRLTYLDMSALTNVASIGTGFLRNCAALPSVDLSRLLNVRQIADAFFADCTALTSLDLSPLANVSQMRNGFLMGCTALMSLDLSPLTSIAQIGNGFLLGCASLTCVDLSSIENLNQIDNGFLIGCSALQSVDLSPLKNV
eukprot:PhM_4_TR18850/c1_g1_i1/m.43449